jgi:hypothetical protein
MIARFDSHHTRNRMWFSGTIIKLRIIQQRLKEVAMVWTNPAFDVFELASEITSYRYRR